MWQTGFDFRGLHCMCWSSVWSHVLVCELSWGLRVLGFWGFVQVCGLGRHVWKNGFDAVIVEFICKTAALLEDCLLYAA